MQKRKGCGAYDERSIGSKGDPLLVSPVLLLQLSRTVLQGDEEQSRLHSSPIARIPLKFCFEVLGEPYLRNPQTLKTQPYALCNIFPLPSSWGRRNLCVHDGPFTKVGLAEERLARAGRMGWVATRRVEFDIASFTEDVEECLCIGWGGIFGPWICGKFLVNCAKAKV